MGVKPRNNNVWLRLQGTILYASTTSLRVAIGFPFAPLSLTTGIPPGSWPTLPTQHDTIRACPRPIRRSTTPCILRCCRPASPWCLQLRRHLHHTPFPRGRRGAHSHLLGLSSCRPGAPADV